MAGLQAQQMPMSTFRQVIACGFDAQTRELYAQNVHKSLVQVGFGEKFVENKKRGKRTEGKVQACMTSTEKSTV